MSHDSRLDFPPDDISDEGFLSLPSYHSEDEILFDELDDPDDECFIDDYGDYIDGIFNPVVSVYDSYSFL